MFPEKKKKKETLKNDVKEQGSLQKDKQIYGHFIYYKDTMESCMGKGELLHKWFFHLHMCMRKAKLGPLPHPLYMNLLYTE